MLALRIKIGESMMLNTMVFVKDRLYENSTQLYLEDFSFDGDEFFVPVGNRKQPIGYLRFKLTEKAKCFELQSLENLDYPNPNPQLSLSGVAYSRQAALEAHQALSAYVQ